MTAEEIQTRNQELYYALDALAGMWNQYCPPPSTHMFMSAGEEAEDVLVYWGLLRPNETAIYPEDDDAPQRVKDLFTPPPPTSWLDACLAQIEE